MNLEGLRLGIWTLQVGILDGRKEPEERLLWGVHLCQILSKPTSYHLPIMFDVSAGLKYIMAQCLLSVPYENMKSVILRGFQGV